MKKPWLLLFSLFFLFILVSCSNSNEEAEGSDSGDEKIVEIEIQNASYILSGQDGGEPTEDEQGGLMQIDLQVKNISEDSVQMFPDQDMQLYDGDQQIDPSKDTYHPLGLEVDTNSSIGPGKQKDTSVIFNVDKDTEYELIASPMSSDYEIDPENATVSLDTSEYNESLESLQEPGEALEAHIDTIYLDKDNSNYEKLVSADKNDLQDEALTEFEKMLEESLSNDISDSDMEKHYESFRDALADKSEIEATVIAHVNDEAIVGVEYTSFSGSDLSSKLREYKDKYSDKHDNDYDIEKEEEYALSKFDKLVDELDVEKGERNLELMMKKEDGNWIVDDSHTSEEKDLRSAFAGGFI